MSVGVDMCGAFYAERECESQCVHIARVQYCFMSAKLKCSLLITTDILVL